MGRITEKDKKAMQQLVRDCEILGLTEQESLEYIQKRFGKKISRSNYYSIKSNLKKNEQTIFKNRLDHHTKIQFVEDHFTRIDELSALQKMLLKTVYEELSKPIEKRNLIGISKIASNINDITSTLTVLSSGSPLFEFLLERKVNEVKGLIINNNSIPIPDINDNSIKENRIRYPSSSLILPDMDEDNESGNKELDSEAIFS